MIGDLESARRHGSTAYWLNFCGWAFVIVVIVFAMIMEGMDAIIEKKIKHKYGFF